MKRFLALTVLTACTVAGCGKAVVPSADSSRDEFSEIVSTFRRNRESFKSLRIVEHRERTKTKDHFLWLANGFEKGANKDRAVEMRQQAESAPIVTRYFQDFYTDRTRFQARGPRDASHADEWEFPDELPAPESLATTYKTYTIYSYTASSEHPLRIWTGYKGKGVTFAQISSKREYEGYDDFWFPPLVTGTGDWGKQKWHPIDEFFRDARDEYHVLGTETVGDTTLTTVEHKQFTDTTLISDDGEILQQALIRKAWINLKCGAIPIRIEERVGLAVSGRVLGESSLFRTIVVTDMRHIDGAGYCPTRGTIETFDLHPQPERPFSTVDDWAASQTQQLPPLVGERIEWTIDRVEANTAMESELFALSFPTYVGVLVDGQRIKIRDPVSPLAVNAEAPDWVVAGWTDGKTRAISDYKGKVVVLDFWGTWCGPCKRAIPTMNRLQEKHLKEDIAFLAIHTAGFEIDEVRTLCKELKNELVCAVDSGVLAEDGETVSRYQVRGFPTVIIIDKAGRVAFNDGDVSDMPAAERRIAEIEASLNLPKLDREASPSEMMDRTERVREALLNDEIVRALAR